MGDRVVPWACLWKAPLHGPLQCTNRGLWVWPALMCPGEGHVHICQRRAHTALGMTSCPAPDAGLFFLSLQATSRRSSRERKTLSLWPHNSATAARPRPGETWVPSAEVGKEGHHPALGKDHPAATRPGRGWEVALVTQGFPVHQVAAQSLPQAVEAALLWGAGSQGRGGAAWERVQSLLPGVLPSQGLCVCLCLCTVALVGP